MAPSTFFLATVGLMAVTYVSMCEAQTTQSFMVYPTSCVYGSGESYRGTQSTTESGLTCQAWDSQTPHEHSRNSTNYPNAGLEGNYCRNPDGEPRTWCYTTDPGVRWQYCSIPSCYGQDNCYTGNGQDYRGNAMVTASGRRCQRWDSQAPHPHGNTPASKPDAGLQNDYCRNPDGEGQPWCYTMDPGQRWEHCGLPVCGSGPTQAPTAPPDAYFSYTSDCYFGSGLTYRGTISTTQGGITCQRWDSRTPHDQDYPNRFPLGDLRENYCRNPDGPPYTPWCYTTDPNVLWDYCQIPKCYADECYVPDGADYRGTVAVTSSGRRCQPWNSQSPHQHDRTPQNYPQAGLTNNYCRNPDDDTSPWCYTIDPNVRVEYCPLDLCTGWTGDYILSGDFTVQTTHCAIGAGASYRGTLSRTESGLTCQRWDSQTPQQHNYQPSSYPDAGLDENYCRNPDGEPRTWCFTTDSSVRWQYCNIPACFDESECYNGNGESYRGSRNVTSSGRACQRWDSQTPHPHSRTPDNFPSAGLDENFCRNPDGEAEPWCYTQDPNTRWERCALNPCGSGPTQAPTAPPDAYFSYTSDCYFGSGLTYRGTVSTTQGGITCQRWDSTNPHNQDDPIRFPFADLRENYCRNPDGPPFTPWCYTTDPNILWDYCQIPKCYANECYVPDGADYRGTVAVTSSGRRCQAWNSQSPHQHDRTPQNYPQAGLTNNYCRNPDDDTSPWCYTIDPNVRVEYCPLDLCTGWTGDYILSGDFTVQTTHCAIGAGASYRGTLSRTESGLTCQRWDSQTPQQHNYQPSRYPDAGLDENYCRNPDGEPRTWCFTTDPNVYWEYCSIPSCFDESECYNGNGESYRGSRNVTTSGRACQRWDSQTPHPHSRTPDNFPSAGLDENFCRNPDGEAEPWCYTQDPNTRWERCALNPCVAPSPTTTMPDYIEKPTSCYFGDGATYRGQVSTTETGITCQRWDSQNPHQQSMVDRYPNSGLDENYCRNPDSAERPWCYTTDPSNRWQYCSIPACYPGDCYTGDGASYRGTMSVTSSGRRCQPWNSQSPHTHDRTPQNYPQAGLVQNYCRNPDDDTSPWCYTVDPTIRVEYCPLRVCDDTAGGAILGPDGIVYSTNCAFGDGSTYRGTVSQTQSGIPCQRWDSQSPHQHNYPSTYPDAGLDWNFCRNPDGEPMTWCYTTDSNVRWQYCSVPSCFPNECYSGNGADYRGSVNITRSGVACQCWDSQTPHPHSRTPENFPSAGLDENFCRNPDGEAEPWCYTQDPNTRWDVCVIQSCDPSATPPPSAQYQLFPTDCYFGNGETYRGQQARTKYGNSCQRWDSQTPHQHNIPDRYPNAGLENNYCRNPDQHDGGPWCYTTNPNTRWEECDVPKCYDDCYLGNGRDYRGRMDVTSSGRICQRWDTQTPHAHSRTPENYPNSGLINNYCRNPDNDTRPWCYTIDPTSRVEYCPITTCVWTEDVIGLESKVYPKHCYFGDGATYRGIVSITSAGLTCQRWDSQTPHPHDQTVRHPDAGLDGNYCRNPDGEPMPWCYTTDVNVRWQYCTVPQCFNDCYNGDGTSYRGTVNITSSGRACQRWDSQTPHPHTRTPTSYPSAGLDENFCRNPDGEAEPWCYTQDPYVRWESCVISNCDGTVPPPSHRYKVFPENCYFGDGSTYRGEVSVSKDGIPCQRWDSQTPHQHDIPSRFPNTELNENYCRNPDGWDRPWCYTTDPNIRWQVCDIPGCFPGECYNDRGVSYRGKVNVTSSGRACQRWDSQTPHQHLSTTADTFPQAGLQDNYCRNPNNDVKPWCYTVDPLARIEFCVVPNCANYTGPQPQKGGSNTGGIVAGVIAAILVVVVAALGVAYYFLFWRKRMDDGKGLVQNESPVAGSVGFQDILARDDKTDPEGTNTFNNPNYDLTEQSSA